MKPQNIHMVLDLARRARKNNMTFNPLFVGPPGLGKSEIVQAWARENDMPFIDIRGALLEAPDLIGFPQAVIKNGREVTKHFIPDFWPFEGEGVLFLDEVNRSQTSVMNAFMQLLTDRKVKDYKLPDGWIIVGAINPEDEHHDVTAMDAAMKDRFEMFFVEYNKTDFVNFMTAKAWDTSIINFVETNTWTYLRPEEVAKNEGAKYNSPRTFSKLNAAIKSGIPESKNDEFEKMIYNTILGQVTGQMYYHFKNNAQPVLYRDLSNKKTMKDALAKLKMFANPNDYKAGTVAVTIRDIIEEGSTIADGLLAQVLLVLPADQSVQLLSELEFKRGLKDTQLTEKIFVDYPEVKKYLRDVLKQK